MISDFWLISVQEFAAKYIFITATPRLPHCYPKAFPNKAIIFVPLYHSNAKKIKFHQILIKKIANTLCKKSRTDAKF